MTALRLVRPSRQFMIQQAVLNVAAQQTISNNPRRWLKVFMEIHDRDQFGSYGKFIIPMVLFEFRRLESRYS